MVGPFLAAGPFMLAKGGISTKPSMLRILGLRRAAPPMAVERERPLDPEQSTPKTIALALRAVLRAVDGATSLPLLLLAPLGIAASWLAPDGRRNWLFLGTILGLTILAMTRLHALSGYCTPRHAMVAAWILIPASAQGFNGLARAVSRAVTTLRSQSARVQTIEQAIRLSMFACCLAWWGPAAVAAIDPGFGGYRQAGEWLANSALAGEGLIDPKGFAIFYAGKPGYTFATLGQGIHDPAVRWVVAHEALIYGPWEFSKAVRTLVGDRRPIRIFPAKPARGVCKVYVYDLSQQGDRVSRSVDQDTRFRR
jgi:hypothetical protein